MTVEEAAKKYVGMISQNSTATFLDQDDPGFLGISFRGDLEDIQSLRSIITIQTLFADKQNNQLILNIATEAKPDIENGYNIPIILNSGTIEALIRIANNSGKVHMFLGSNDLSVVAVKPVMENEVIKESIKLNLIKLGVWH